jgi:hypothetical protein
MIIIHQINLNYSLNQYKKLKLQLGTNMKFYQIFRGQIQGPN